ncbi:chaperonin-like RBCX protein 1, chloroplastic isoform X2 [Phragmites australis]|uniref:chaperonin-like RBCX protein 1, chloroplastic isoform X2 n=1 Tax=Phragmites australis TaxID=29695 RepID=UPI002D77BB2E|nr:chaperonin-like RBCX protein 1, chloroplastic isoform X2 [Phragmites australis]
MVPGLGSVRASYPRRLSGGQNGGGGGVSRASWRRRGAARCFGEGSPEKKAATNLQHFFNYVAVRIVLAQLESYNREAYVELKEFVSRTSLNDAETFCKNLIRESPRHKGLAMRILEVRSAYVKTDFEWDNLKKLSFKMVDEANTKLMRDYVLEVSHIEDENYKT